MPSGNTFFSVHFPFAFSFTCYFQSPPLLVLSSFPVFVLSSSSPPSPFPAFFCSLIPRPPLTTSGLFDPNQQLPLCHQKHLYGCYGYSLRYNYHSNAVSGRLGGSGSAGVQVETHETHSTASCWCASEHSFWFGLCTWKMVPNLATSP